MQVTGYELRAAIRQWELRRDAAVAQFPGSLAIFDGERKDSPQAVTLAFLHAERMIATLQTAQARYNLGVMVSLDGGAFTLAEAVKRVGGVARMEKLWRAVVVPATDRYHDPAAASAAPRSTTHTYARATFTAAEAIATAEKLAREKGQIAQAIAEANATRLEVDDLADVYFD
jgi:ribosomal protein S5